MLVIRKARLEDDEAIWRVHTSAIRELCKGHYTPEEIEAWAGRLVVGIHRPAITLRDFLVAELDGILVGFGQLDQRTGEVEAVYVDPTATRRGVGSALLRELEARARAAGLQALHLDASLNSVRFYESAGYQCLRAARHALTSSTDIACIVMEKRWEKS